MNKHTRVFHTIGLGLGLLLLIAGALNGSFPALAAPLPQFSPTPAPVVLPTISPSAIVLVTPTATRTPTPVGPALVEALEGPTNVRSGPDINAERLGQIFPGETYPVLGRAAGTLWYKIQYPDSPTGTAWVFEQVVNITGNIDAIPELEVLGAATVDVGRAQATQTIEALAQTPGALETATAQAFAAGIVRTAAPNEPTSTPLPLPTFTFPPGAESDTVLPTLVVQQTVRAAEGDGLPPILPIIGLGIAGALGLLVSVLRRLR